MRDNTSRIFSRRNIFYFAVWILLVSSIIYLLPSFQKKYKENYYTFKNIPSLSDKSYENLTSSLPNITSTYQYILKSSVKIDDKLDLRKILLEDKNTLESRLTSLVGKNFEVNAFKDKDNFIKFIISSTQDLTSYLNVLTKNNSDFELKYQETTSVTTQVDPKASPTPTPEPKFIKVDLSRKDFGKAEILEQAGQQGMQYQIRLPLGLVGPERIKKVEQNEFNQLTISIGGDEYPATFSAPGNQYVSQDKITTLLVGQINTLAQANSLRTYLNSPKYALGYTIESKNILNKDIDKNLIRVIGLVALFVLSSILINRYFFKNLSNKKLFYLIFLTLILLAATKLFALEISLSYLLIATSLLILTLFNTKNIFIYLFLSVLFVTKVLGYLYYLPLSWMSFAILVIFGIGLSFVNYIKVIDKRYE